jgi:hypothetical protein
LTSTSDDSRDSSTPSQPPSNESGYGSSLDTAKSQVDFSSALENWVIAMRRNNPDLIAACYAPHVDRYFLQQNWDPAKIRSYLIHWFQGGAREIDEFSVAITSLHFTQPIL